MMVTQLNIVSDDKTRHLITPGNVDSINYFPDQNADQTKHGFAIKVSSILQTTLEIESLIKLFSQQIKPAIPHDGLTYHNDPLGLSFHFGKKCKNQCQYRLLVNGEPLGEISLHRRWDFSSEDNKIFEYTLCGLVYPLRNAILYQQALHAANKDALSGVYNRSTFEETLNREVKLAHRYNRSLSIVILDIDNFKNFNDSFGHALGDQVIKSTAANISACVRSTDIVFRYGGEEFVALLSNTSVEGAVFLAERIRHKIESSLVNHDNNSVNVTASLGISELTEGEQNASFFSRADKALYEAKKSGKNKFCIAE
ncbi:MAG: GGDEF domain-containing protein [Gammaproteobacteria bacterium]|nr:GGDEF domain-containing protein [Gammaproteobacteria bacterium]